METDTMTNDIKSQVLSIVRDIEQGRPRECCSECDATLGKSSFCPECETHNESFYSGFDYISDVLDINYVINSDRTYRGTRLLVAFGGPNIWVDTSTNTVTGSWWGDSYSAKYSRDEMDIDEACFTLYTDELFGCA